LYTVVNAVPRTDWSQLASARVCCLQLSFKHHQSHKQPLMKPIKAPLFPSRAINLLAMLLVMLVLVASPSSASADKRRPPTRTTTEKEAASCTFEYVGSDAETCAGYNGFPCTCTIHCPSCLQEDNTCTGLSVAVINNICGNSGWQEADRYPVWRYYTVTTYIRRYD